MTDLPLISEACIMQVLRAEPAGTSQILHNLGFGSLAGDIVLHRRVFDVLSKSEDNGLTCQHADGTWSLTEMGHRVAKGQEDETRARLPAQPPGTADAVDCLLAAERWVHQCYRMMPLSGEHERYLARVLGGLRRSMECLHRPPRASDPAPTDELEIGGG